MRAFAKQQGGIAVTVVDNDEPFVAFCEVPGCYRHAAERISMAGHPAGFTCVQCARAWMKLWTECIAEVENVAEAA